MINFTNEGLIIALGVLLILITPFVLRALTRKKVVRKSSLPAPADRSEGLDCTNREPINQA